MMYHFRMSMLASVTLSLSLFAAGTACAQCPPAWVPGIGMPGITGVGPVIHSLAVLPGGDVIVGGNFNSVPDAVVINIARYNMAYGVWSALGPGIGGTVRGVGSRPNGDLIATSAGQVLRYSLISGGVWSTLGGTNGNILALVVLPSGDIIAGGTFTETVGGPLVTLNRITRMPLAGGSAPLGVGTDNWVTALAVLPGGDVVVGGWFGTAGGVPASRIARVNPTTSVWSALGTGTDNTVYALLALPDGDVIVGGDFTTAGGVAASRIARVNPTTGVWSALGSGTDGRVQALAVLPGGDVIAAGAFTTAGGVAASNIARYNPTTNVWSALGSGTNALVRALAVLPGGDVIMAGEFTTAGGTTAGRIARYYPGAAAPRIITQPQPVVTVASNSAMFYCGATGGAVSGTPTYQWRKGGVALDTIANPSAATAVLSLTNVQLVDLGSYNCLVTNSCGGGGTLSNAATLTFVADACPADFNDDGVIDFFDYLDYVQAFSIGC